MVAEARLEAKSGRMLLKAQGLGVASFIAASNFTVVQDFEYATLSTYVVLR